MRFFLRYFFIFAVIFFPVPISAHVPVLMKDGGVFSITDPKLSQAFYGELHDAPQVFRIDSGVPVPLYVNLMVPERSNAEARYSASIYRVSGGERSIVFLLAASSSPWMRFYEPYFGDAYIRGPEFKAAFPKGIYEIEVTGNDNSGRYVLAVGEEERFTLPSALQSFLLFPSLKTQFFEQSLFTTLHTLAGFVFVFLFVFLGVLISFLSHLIFVFFKFKSWLFFKKRNLKRKERYLRIGLVFVFLILGLFASGNLLFFVLSGFFFYEILFSFSLLSLFMKRRFYGTYELA